MRPVAFFGLLGRKKAFPSFLTFFKGFTFSLGTEELLWWKFWNHFHSTENISGQPTPEFRILIKPEVGQKWTGSEPKNENFTPFSKVIRFLWERKNLNGENSETTSIRQKTYQRSSTPGSGSKMRWKWAKKWHFPPIFEGFTFSLGTEELEWGKFWNHFHSTENISGQLHTRI